MPCATAARRATVGDRSRRARLRVVTALRAHSPRVGSTGSTSMRRLDECEWILFFFRSSFPRPGFQSKRTARPDPRVGVAVFFTWGNDRAGARSFPAPRIPRPASRVRISKRGRAGGIVDAARKTFSGKRQVTSLGATAMDMSSWKSSLHAYGSITCTTFVRSLGFLQHSNVWFLRFATATKPHVWHTWMRYASD